MSRQHPFLEIALFVLSVLMLSKRFLNLMLHIALVTYCQEVGLLVEENKLLDIIFISDLYVLIFLSELSGDSDN